MKSFVNLENRERVLGLVVFLVLCLIKGLYILHLHYLLSRCIANMMERFGYACVWAHRTSWQKSVPEHNAKHFAVVIHHYQEISKSFFEGTRSLTSETVAIKAGIKGPRRIIPWHSPVSIFDSCRAYSIVQSSGRDNWRKTIGILWLDRWDRSFWRFM